MAITPVELSGQRAKLVPMNESHVEGLFKAGQYSEIWTYLSMMVESMEHMEKSSKPSNWCVCKLRRMAEIRNPNEPSSD